MRCFNKDIIGDPSKQSEVYKPNSSSRSEVSTIEWTNVEILDSNDAAGSRYWLTTFLWEMKNGTKRKYPVNSVSLHTYIELLALNRRRSFNQCSENQLSMAKAEAVWAITHWKSVCFLVLSWCIGTNGNKCYAFLYLAVIFLVLVSSTVGCLVFYDIGSCLPAHKSNIGTQQSPVQSVLCCYERRKLIYAQRRKF